MLFFSVTAKTVCPLGTVLGPTGCVMAANWPLTFNRALDHCHSEGGELLYIETEEELAQVKTILRAFNGRLIEPPSLYYIGMF